MANPHKPGSLASKPAPKFEMRPPGVLKPNPRNARKRTKREVQRIADSIESAGNLQPIVVDENDVILAGHGRLAAAKARMAFADAPYNLKIAGFQGRRGADRIWRCTRP